MVIRLYEFIFRQLLKRREVPRKLTTNDALKMNAQDDIIRDIPRKYIEGLKMRDAKKGQ